jgi:putative GTP pyrophosphokinase
MTEMELQELYNHDKSFLEAWGNFVKAKILDELSKTEDSVEFLEIQPSVRLKAIDSLIAKAFHRQKPYKNPYNEITDKVGIRFVVLLTTDIQKISSIVENLGKTLWRASKDRDFEDEREHHPEEFTYESVHYVVYNRETFKYGNVDIPRNTPCEIQIRTLLQHAYAEMAHDTIYKPQVKTNGAVKRCLARSMALVESADYFFIEALKEIDQQTKPYTDLNELCMRFYPIEFQKEVDTNLNSLIIDTLYSMLKDIPLSDIESWMVKQQTFLNSLVKKRHSKFIVCRQSAILLIYFLIDTKQELLDQEWKWPKDILRQLESDMGITPMAYGRQ